MRFIEFSNLHDLRKAFPDEETAIAYLEKMRWAGNPVSPFNEASTVYKCSGHKYRCKITKKYFTIRTGTIFSDSKIPLVKWIEAIYLFATHKKGVSSYQLAEFLGIRQKAAWFMLHRIRFAMSRKGIFDFPLTGTIEADETFIGGKEGNKHKDKKATQGFEAASPIEKKQTVFGMVQRGGKAIMQHVPDNKSTTIQPILLKHAWPGNVLMTDEGYAYAGADQHYTHQYVKHVRKEYVRGDVHTNTIENLWSVVKRVVHGTYHFTSKKHLQAYLEEISFRYNRRKMSGYHKTNTCIEKTFKGSLKWNTLIRKEAAK